MSNKKVVVFMADGTETCEALTIVDLLKRADIDVVTASALHSKKIVTSCGTTMECDFLAEDIDYSNVDMIVLPGGMPGTKYLAENDLILKQCISFNETNKYIAAICAAPSILGRLNILNNKNAICYPGFEKELLQANIKNEGVVVDKNIITSKALGSAIDFSLVLIEKLKDSVTAQKVANEIYYTSK